MGQPIELSTYSGHPMGLRRVGCPRGCPIGYPMGCVIGYSMGYPIGWTMGQPMGHVVGHHMAHPMRCLVANFSEISHGNYYGILIGSWASRFPWNVVCKSA